MQHEHDVIRARFPELASKPAEYLDAWLTIQCELGAALPPSTEPTPLWIEDGHGNILVREYEGVIAARRTAVGLAGARTAPIRGQA